MSYQPDDGPLTDEQEARIRELSPDMPDEAMTDNLFNKAAAHLKARRLDISDLAAIIHEIIGNDGLLKWPMLETQALSVDLVLKLIDHVKRESSIFVMGADLADYARSTQTEEYYNVHGNLGPMGDFMDVCTPYAGRASGYVGMLMGCDVYTHSDLPPNMIMLVQRGHETKAVIGYVKI